MILNSVGHAVSWFFLLDICYKFNLAYLDGDGNIIVSRTKIRKRYMVLSKFWFDLLIGFPWYIFIDEGDSVTKGYFRIFRMIRLIRLNNARKVLS